MEQHVVTLLQPKLNRCSPSCNILTLDLQYFCAYFNLFRDSLFTLIKSITLLIDIKRLKCLILFYFIVYPPDLLVN